MTCGDCGATPYTGLSTSRPGRRCRHDCAERRGVQPAAGAVAGARAAVGRYERLREAVQDRWHQPARAALVPQLAAALALEDPDVWGRFSRGPGHRWRCWHGANFARVEQLLRIDCTSALGVPSTVRTLPCTNRLECSRTRLRPRTGEPYEIRRRIDVSSVRRDLSARSAVGVLRVPGSARGVVRLRGHPRGHEPQPDRVAAADRCGATRSCCRSRSRAPASTPASRRSCAPRGSRRSWASRSSTSRTTPSIIRRSPTRTASCRSRPPAPSSSGSRCSGARRRAILPAASPPTPRGSGCRATSSFPTISSRRRCSAPRSTSRTSSRSKATTTTSTGSARRSRIGTGGDSRTSTCGATTPKARRRWASRLPSSLAGASRITSSRPSPAARCFRASSRGSASSGKSGSSTARCRRSMPRSRRDRRPSSGRSTPGLEFPEPVKPDTIAKSLAIGNPADGFQVVRVVKETGGSGAMVSDEEILDAIQLLARTEGIFTEPAGGTTLAATRALDQARRHQAARVGRRVHHGQRLQDRRGDVRPRGAADADRAQPRGFRAGGRLADRVTSPRRRWGNVVKRKPGRSNG